MKRFMYTSSGFGTNSYSVFDRSRKNQFGESFCVAPMVTYEQAKEIANKLNAGNKKTFKNLGIDK